MAVTKIQAKTKEKPTPVEAEYDFGDGTLKGLVEKFGEDVIYSRAMSALVIDVQALMRRQIEAKDYSLDKLRKAVAEWKPTVSNGVRRSATEKIEDTVAKMSDEQRAELLARLQKQIAAGKGNTGAGQPVPPQAGKPGTKPAARQ
jgi:hypothetical protein